ncbi:MAG TPA: hypothetical protein VGO90_14480, partial [Chthoniobacteraceae bacterium]|nr:hypothetical protein [Chthoniobacteraceae bacterium]
NWIIKLSANSSAAESAQFQFPKAKDPAAKVAYKRYSDADLVDVTPELALAGFPLRSRKLWPWALLGMIPIAGGVWLVARYRLRAKPATSQVAYDLPATITPFTTLQLLRQMHGDEKLALSEANRSELNAAIAGIESFYFARSHNGDAAPDLQSIGQQWVGRVSGR